MGENSPLALYRARSVKTIRSWKVERIYGFPSEQEQIEKFERIMAQHYFEVLRTLISKSVFAQQVGLKGSRKLSGWDFSSVLELEVERLMRLYSALCHGTFQEFASDAKTLIFSSLWHCASGWGSGLDRGSFYAFRCNGFMWAWGVDDDRSHITARLSALRKYIRTMMIYLSISAHHGESGESASTGLDKYLEKHADKLH